ncbi:MAG: hypothetical protein HY514_04895 [Candidatus Aenigmarchaeota archaeon]|nr:hypothetical protein [Candidatus Aenigmarchaeota archaeon]
MKRGIAAAALGVLLYGCGSEAPKPRTEKSAYSDVTRNGITRREYPTHIFLIERTADSHVFYGYLKSDENKSDQGLDSVSYVHLIDTNGGRREGIDGVTYYARGAFPEGFNLEGVRSHMQEPLERTSPEFKALETGSHLDAWEKFNK